MCLNYLKRKAEEETVSFKGLCCSDPFTVCFVKGFTQLDLLLSYFAFVGLLQLAQILILFVKW